MLPSGKRQAAEFLMLSQARECEAILNEELAWLNMLAKESFYYFMKGAGFVPNLYY